MAQRPARYDRIMPAWIRRSVIHQRALTCCAGSGLATANASAQGVPGVFAQTPVPSEPGSPEVAADPAYATSPF